MAIAFHQKKLPNGLTVIAEPNNDAHPSAVGFFVKTGKRDEDKAHMGVSHFLEHMMFKGTAKRSAEDLNREFDEIGAYNNAYTSNEMTVYYAQILPEYLPRAIDLLGDMLRPALREQDFTVEKNVILEEIGMYEDRPHSRLYDTLLETYFGEHPLSYRVLGTVDSIKALTSKQMEGYFEHRYSPDNITVAAAGRIDFDFLCDEVERVAGHWKPTGARREYVDPTITQGDYTITDAKLNRAYMAIMAPGPSAQDERRYAASIISDVLGDSSNSRLYWALVDPGLADDAEVAILPYDQTGAYFAYASCDPERAREVEKKLIETIESYPDTIEPSEIERAKNKVATSATLQGENPGGRMRGLGSQWAYLGEYRSLKEELERITAVTIDEVKAVLKEWAWEPRTIVRLKPE